MKPPAGGNPRIVGIQRCEVAAQNYDSHHGRQAGGPDEEFNGLALCTLHHKLFDRGVFTLSDKLHIIVSESANGTRGFQEWVIAFHGEALRPPQSPTYFPGKSVVEWHVKEVFQGPER